MKEDLAVLELGRFHLTAAEREALQSEKGITTDELLRLLVTDVQRLALVPVSDFRVGTSGLNADGEIFLGVNLEFAGASFAQTVHAEQFLVSLSRLHSASPLVRLAVSAPPCGHCRQFLTEFDPKGELTMLIGDEPGVKMKELLPRAFSPADLHVAEPFYSTPPQLLNFDSLEQAAKVAALHSYVPYSKTRAGIAVRTASGEIYLGSALENAAYNPALPPLQAAIVSAYAGGHRPEEIRDVVLCQERGGRIDYESQQRDLTVTLSPSEVSFKTVYL